MLSFRLSTRNGVPFDNTGKWESNFLEINDRRNCFIKRKNWIMDYFVCKIVSKHFLFDWRLFGWYVFGEFETLVQNINSIIWDRP